MKAEGIQALMHHFSQMGTLEWIGVRPERRADVLVLNEVSLSCDTGLAGDHYSNKSTKRQVTLIQREHLIAVSSYMGMEVIDPALLRRNLVIKGLNLLSLKGQRFYIGECLLEYTGACHPCSRMEEILGTGGYNAMRGHGGITARVLSGGTIALGDRLSLKFDQPITH